jgi:glutamyl-Q tRNA(Asp) synthetase
LGSLVAALASFADARSRGGVWVVRMEDLDPLREVPGAADDILRALDAFGFEWDGPVLYQSKRGEAYAEALAHLDRLGLSFQCACSRKDIALSGRPGAEGPVYPGTCRRGPPAGRQPRTVRLRVETPPIGFEDRIQGRLAQDLRREVGDFVIRRADAVHAYQLAVVVDDAFQGINQVVRGADLVRSTPRQIFLQRCLDLQVPHYAHLPVVLDAYGQKLSKSSAAAPVDPREPLPALLQAWSFLGQAPMAEMPPSLAEFWGQALSSWDAWRVPRRASASLPAAGNA